LITWDNGYPGPENVIPLRLRCAAAVAIVPPAGAAAAVNWRSNVDPVGLGRALRSDIFRQLLQLIGARTSIRWI